MVYTTETKKCDVFITTNRNRVKTYGTQVYLKDGQKFEIELFNPYTYKVLAKVKMNGHYISDAGLVINPGQRIYLERYLDSNNAFIFSTYEIDGTVEALRAISENGNLEVEFYSEYVPSGWNPNQITWTYFPQHQPVYGGNTTNDIYLYSSSDIIGQNTSIHSASMGFSYFSSNLNEPVKGSMETGRVEKGGKTKQEFTTSNDNFNSWAFETAKLKILPVSAKPIEVKEIRNYCTECGTRMKKTTWKFCPNCGNKL
jgi:zinc-ribbon domain